MENQKIFDSNDEETLPQKELKNDIIKKLSVYHSNSEPKSRGSSREKARKSRQQKKLKRQIAKASRKTNRKS